ncbi:zinc finger protein 502-like [Boleophthalmus pectinirostris]|uniref:zinc finger protein 502-like n=1 Tax=Boleophthalmus pectinirostris TaxID=150288 RepID=UPI000A1C6E7F|nr:zinc finger protein 502-like [Boleophthalmus pectinirostris]
MEKRVSALPGSSLSLSYLRLLIPPHRLISAAIWQTVDQKIVSDYGLLEEFVFRVTDIVPQLLSTRQRAELILGLRARLILELCRCEDTAQIQIIQPHLDRMQELEALWSVVTPNAESEQSESHFMALVKNLLRDPDERKNFFNDVFPGDFGPTYDKAIQTLMWLFLSRLEKLLPTQSLQQIASLLGDPSCVLNEYMESFSDPQELKLLLDTYKDLSQLDNIDSLVVESGILSALCLPSEERVLIVSAQAVPDSESGVEYTICSEMEVESDDKVYVGPDSCEDAVNAQWVDLGNEVKSEAIEIVVHSVEGSKDNHHTDKSDTLMIGEDGQVTVLGEQAKRRRGRPKKVPQDEDYQVKLSKEQLEDPDFVLGQRPVRKNRGLKMKRLLSQWKRTKTKSSNNAKKSPSSDLDDRTCKVCGMEVAQSKLLERHMSQHADEAPYSCYSCEKVYKSLRFLQRHKCSSVVKDKSQQPKADTDGQETADADGAEEDTEAGDDKSVAEGPFYCPQCSAEFKCRQTFRFHLRNICYDEQQVDPEKTEDDKHCFKCDQCDKAFKYKSTLDSHKQTHNPLYCHACMKLVRDSDALALHKESHTPFQCNHCEENFPVFKALHKHYVDVHNPSEPYTCTHCQTTFVSLKRFIRHEWKHTGYQPFQCPQCVKRFRSYSDLVEHQRKHTKAYPYLCWECGKKFRHSLTLTRHVARVHHSGEPVLEKPAAAFGCLQCGKMFTSRRCLLKHDNFHHKGLRFPCEFCGKGFFGKDALVRHTLIHTGERPFKCDDCEKSFRSLAELKIHRRYHTGERPFKCTVCQKGFVQSCFLTLHMRSHTGERPYVCAVCSKGFTSLHGLKRHRRLVHT